MIRNVLVSFLVLAVITPLAGQSHAPATSPDWSDHYRRSTIAFGKIITEGKTKRFEPIGTGVIVATDIHHGFIVTAKHVFDEPSIGWHPAELRVRFAWQDNEPLEKELGTPVRLLDSKGNNLWSALGDGSDIAALPTPSDFNGLPLHAIAVSDFASKEEIYDGETVFILGFPQIAEAFGKETLVRDITRSGVIAWTNPKGPLTHPFLIDANILPGNSGGPVLSVPAGLSREGTFVIGGRVALLGIVTEDVTEKLLVFAHGRVTLYKWSDLPNPSLMVAPLVGYGGIGKVEPASEILTLINQISSQLSKRAQ